MKSKVVREKETVYRATASSQQSVAGKKSAAGKIASPVRKLQQRAANAGSPGTVSVSGKGPLADTDDPVKQAVAARVTRLLEIALRDATPERLQDALEAPTDTGSAAHLLSISAMMEDAVRALDPTAAAIMRGAVLKQDLLRRAGGVAETARVAELLGISTQAVVKRVRSGTLLAIVDPSGHLQFPMLQFTDTGVIAGFEKVLAAFTVESSWTRLALLLDTDANVGGKTVIDALRAGELNEVLEVVRSFGG